MKFDFWLMASTALISAGAAQAQITDPISSPAERYVVSPSGIDMRTGQFTFSNADLKIGGERGISFIRNSGSSEFINWQPMGRFSHNWHIFVSYKPGKSGENYSGAQFIVNAGSRGQSFDNVSNTNNFTNRSVRARAELKAASLGSGATNRYFVYTAPDGAKITFRSDLGTSDGGGLSTSFASKVEEPDGTTYDLSYDEPSGSDPALLRRVVSNRGYALILEYVANAQGKFVSKTCAFNLAVAPAPTTNTCPVGSYAANYAYGTNGLMTSYTDPLSVVTQFASTFSPSAWSALKTSPSGYTYTDSHYYPGETSPYLTNTVFRKYKQEMVSSQSYVDGRTYSFSWNQIMYGENDDQVEYAGGTSTRNDGATFTVSFQVMSPSGWVTGRPKLISVAPSYIKDEINRISTGNYCLPIGGGSNCNSVDVRYWIGPEGERTDFTYDAFGNITKSIQKPKTGAADPNIERNMTFSCTVVLLCAKPQSSTDANLNTTNFSYDSTHGGLLTETDPAVGGINPQKRYGYVQRYAWIKNAANTAYVQAISPVWVLDNEEFCKTTTASGGNCGGGAADEVVTTYDYGPTSGPNNLFLRGKVITADGVSLRTCYSYDQYGNKISETLPRANLTSCP